MDSNTNCGKSSATKKLKGFTLVEILIVMALLSIIAGMISIVTSGLMRDSKLEAARTDAQSVYTGLQNMLIQMEIKQQNDLLNPTTYGTTCTPTNYVTLEFIMDNGTIPGAEDFIITDGSTSTPPLHYDYPNADAPADDTERAFRKVAKYIKDNLSMEFTGYVYAAIDMNDWMVDSVVVIEDYNRVKNAANGINDFVPTFRTKSGVLASANKVPFCDDVYQQKNIYAGKETAVLDAAGTAVGFYPFYNDIVGTTVSYT